MKPLRLSLLLATFALSGCATHPPQADGSRAGDDADRAALTDSSIDISYVLGHSHRRLVVWAGKDGLGGQTLLDHQILRESPVERGRYAQFLAKVEQFLNAPRRKPADNDDSCRTPFTITVRVGTETKIVQGCRGEDDGALSHLVRDGEFLLFSNK